MIFIRPWALALPKHTRWRTPWGPLFPVANFGLVVLVYTLVEEVGPAIEDDPPSFLIPMLPVWHDFSFAVGCLAAVFLLGPVFLYRHGWFLRPTARVLAIDRLRMAFLGFAAGFAFKASFILLIWSFVDDQIGSTGMSSPMWSDAFYVSIGVLAACVIVPVWEEWLFRILIYGSLRRRLNANHAILLLSALFSVVHGLVWSSISALFLGLGTSIVYERTRSFLFCIALHSGFNLAAIVLRLLIHRYGVFS